MDALDPRILPEVRAQYAKLDLQIRSKEEELQKLLEQRKSVIEYAVQVHNMDQGVRTLGTDLEEAMQTALSLIRDVGAVGNNGCTVELEVGDVSIPLNRQHYQDRFVRLLQERQKAE